MKEKEYDSEYKFYLDVMVWENMRGFYEALGKPCPPKPIFKPSEEYKNRYEFE